MVVVASKIIPSENVRRVPCVDPAISELLGAWTRQNKSLKLLSETTFLLGEYNSPIPDISLFARSRKPEKMEGWFQGAPEVAIEVVSSEKASLLETKIELYLAHGSKAVWVVYPEQQVVRICDSAGNSRISKRNQTLEDPAAPRFSAQVSAIFEGI